MSLSASSSATAVSVTLVWDANDEPYLTGYYVHYGTESRRYTSKVFVSKEFQTVTVDQLSPNVVYFFAATAVGVDPTFNNKIESGFSNEVVFSSFSNDAGWPATDAEIKLSMN